MTMWCGGSTLSARPPELRLVTHTEPVCATSDSHSVSPASHDSSAFGE